MSNRVGTVRPSQLMYSYGVGSIVDLPNFSVIIGGLDGWDTSATGQTPIVEDRLVQAIRQRHHRVSQLRAAPWLPPEPGSNAFADWARVGVPAYVFPRWLRCTKCNRLAPVESSLFNLKSNPFRPDQAHYEHTNCDKARGRPPKAIPARFVVACARGHLDEFPWDAFAHKFGACTGKPLLTFRDVGSGSRSTDAIVRCETCENSSRLSNAFGIGATTSMPQCRGRHPHLRRFDDQGCTEQARAMLLGASNAWFPETLSALALPIGAGDDTASKVDAQWGILNKVDSRTKLSIYLEANPSLQVAMFGLDLDHVWGVIESRNNGVASDSSVDLLSPEWQLLIHPATAPQSSEFRLRDEGPPSGFGGHVNKTVSAERLREVVALIGFTRVEGPDSGIASDVPSAPSAPLDLRNRPTWVPASEVRGEGIFIQFNEDALATWEAAANKSSRIGALQRAHESWRTKRGLPLSGADWPGARYILIHSFSHAIINQVSLESGYAAASIRERLYVSASDDPGKAMAGVLLYTAAPDAEGTLGGLARLAKSAAFAKILEGAIQRTSLCSADPFCAEHEASPEEGVLHNAACHACLFVPETSCERGNRYLDRAALIQTMGDHDLAPFFPAR
jgi:hypothetical protein